jgi:hypothetical protein
MKEGEKNVWRIVCETPSLAIPVLDNLPLPAQIIFSAAQHFAAKASDGARVRIAYDYNSEKPFLHAYTGKSIFEMEWDGKKLKISFIKFPNEGEIEVRRIALECARERAQDIIACTVKILFDAVSVNVIHSSPELDMIFNIPPPQ